MSADDAARAISVVVCTRDRPEQLATCLSSLTMLQPAAGEVIIVDNAPSTDATRALIAKTAFRRVVEPRPGLDRARNRGVDSARGEIIAFTDDDVRVAPDWVGAIAAAFADPDVDAVTGLVLPAELATPAQRLFESYGGGMRKGTEPRRWHRSAMSTRELLRAQDVGVGANMAFRRTAIQRLGGFDPALDVGTPSGGGGDLDILHRALASGMTVLYSPGVIVHHRHRPEMAALRRQLFDNGRAYGSYLATIWRERTVPRRQVVTFVLGEWFPWLVGRLGKRLVRRHPLPMRLLLLELAGALWSPAAYRASRRQAAVTSQDP